MSGTCLETVFGVGCGVYTLWYVVKVIAKDKKLVAQEPIRPFVWSAETKALMKEAEERLRATAALSNRMKDENAPH